jgi:hypothetical protein
VGTPALLSSGRMEPRKVVGSVDTGEFLVSLGASLGFLFSLGSQRIEMAWVAALLAGGVLAAPLAAWIVRKLPSVVTLRAQPAHCSTLELSDACAPKCLQWDESPGTHTFPLGDATARRGQRGATHGSQASGGRPATDQRCGAARRTQARGAAGAGDPRSP